jgi:DNA-directed RNA polymerase subunit alpha
LLQEHFRYFVDFGNVSTVTGSGNGGRGKDSARLRSQLGRPIDDLGLSVRSINSLKNFNISTLGDLVRYTEEELLRVKNVGEKALSEIAELLRREGLNFGMAFEESDGDVIVTNPGIPPATSMSGELSDGDV